MFGLADILLLEDKKGNEPFISQQDALLTDTFFDMKNVKRYMKSRVGCGNFITRKNRKPVTDEGPRRVLVWGGIAKNDGCCTQFVNAGTEVPRTQVFAENIILRPVWSEESLCKEVSPQV